MSEFPCENRVLTVVEQVSNATHGRISSEQFNECTAAKEGEEASHENCSAEN